MNCPSCGRDVTGKKFCPICGRPVEQVTPQSAAKPEAAPTPAPESKSVPVNNLASNPVKKQVKAETKKSSKTGLMVVLCAAVAAAIVLAGVLVFLSIYNSGGEDTPAPKNKSDIVTEKGEEPQTPSEPKQPEFTRHSTYSSAYTYSNMEEIHSSSEADDKDAFELKDVVTNFNNSWVDYVNSGDTSVFSYLRSGTQAYKYAVAYGDKDISEEYILMEVNDVRKHGDSYYVWTHEIIEETSTEDSSDVERFEYYWVYKVTYSDGGYYIENYISDPAYK